MPFGLYYSVKAGLHASNDVINCSLVNHVLGYEVQFIFHGKLFRSVCPLLYDNSEQIFNWIKVGRVRRNEKDPQATYAKAGCGLKNWILVVILIIIIPLLIGEQGHYPAI